MQIRTIAGRKDEDNDNDNDKACSRSTRPSLPFAPHHHPNDNRTKYDPRDNPRLCLMEMPMTGGPTVVGGEGFRRRREKGRGGVYKSRRARRDQGGRFLQNPLGLASLPPALKKTISQHKTKPDSFYRYPHHTIHPCMYARTKICLLSKATGKTHGFIAPSRHTPPPKSHPDPPHSQQEGLSVLCSRPAHEASPEKKVRTPESSPSVPCACFSLSP